MKVEAIAQPCDDRLPVASPFRVGDAGGLANHVCNDIQMPARDDCVGGNAPADLFDFGFRTAIWVAIGQVMPPLGRV